MSRETEQPDGAQPDQQQEQSEIEQGTAGADAPVASDSWWRGAEGHSEVQ
jgi:hypothetical protein